MSADDASLLVTNEDVSPERSPDRRPWCSRCSRARTQCVCDVLPAGAPLDTRTRIVLFVHPKEVQRKLGTMPLLRTCLRNLVVYVNDRCPSPEEDPDFHGQLTDGGRSCVLVSPGPDAEMLMPPADGAPVDPPKTLIFVDGRWPQARGMVLKSPWLQAIPKAVLCPTEQSGYRFRKQPIEGCLSTLEAVAEALLALEGERGPELKAGLLAPFLKMVELQCQRIPVEYLDKNARFAEHAELPSFDAQAAVERVLGDREVAQGEKVWVVLTWAEKTLSGRRAIVLQVFVGTRPEAKQRAAAMGVGRPRGFRCWCVPIEKVPDGAMHQPAVVDGA